MHRAYEKAHGLPGWIDAVDNEKRLVTVTLFAGIDPALINDFKLKSRVAALVAEDSLRCYDQINDRMHSGGFGNPQPFPPVPATAACNSLSNPRNLSKASAPAASFASSPIPGLSTTCRGRKCSGLQTTV